MPYDKPSLSKHSSNMSGKQAILTKNAPAPLPGIYSQAVVANGFVYCSGCVPMDASTGKLIDGDIKAHTVGLFYPQSQNNTDAIS
jgi:enamine deaminase RidA (YjgF/YER057c/UK114 family)